MDADTISKAERIISDHNICNHCLGRLFLEADGKNNEERGRKIRELVGGKEPENCELCGGFFKKIDSVAWKAAKGLGKYDAKTILVSSQVPQSVLELEQEIWENYKIAQSETIKKDINRTVGKKLEEIGGLKYDPEWPDAVVCVDLQGNVRVESTPIYIIATLCNDSIPKRDVRNVIKEAAEAIFGARDIKLRSKKWELGARIVIEVREPAHRHVDEKTLEEVVKQMMGRRIFETVGRTYAAGARRFLEGR